MTDDGTCFPDYARRKRGGFAQKFNSRGNLHVNPNGMLPSTGRLAVRVSPLPDAFPIQLEQPLQDLLIIERPFPSVRRSHSLIEVQVCVLKPRRAGVVQVG